MVRDNVTFRITVDSKMAEAAFKRLKAEVVSLGGQIEQLGPKTTKLGNDLNNVGKNATASAVNFQTATQGLLNLSTAAVQTYTSISNLDRANNRAKQSVIAVARAEDLLANKKQRANEMVQNGTATGMKYKNILREIETAEADLAVKIEKKGIEQAAVNDIYMLFATNVANVVISSTQTMVVLLGQEKAARIGVQIATKLQTLATWDNVRAARFQAAETRALNALFAGTKTQIHGVTLATRLQTGAINALKVALGPIGLVMIGISAAMAAYESNLGGMKDAINGLLGIQDDFEQQLMDERNAVDELTESFGYQQRKLFELPNNYSGLLRELEKVRSKYVDVTNTVNDNTNAIITNSQLQSNFRTGGGTSQASNGSLNATPTAVLQNSTSVTTRVSSNPAVSQMTNPAGMTAVAWNITSDYQKWQAGYGTGGSFGGPAFRYPWAPGGGSFVLDNPIFGFVPTKTSIILPNGVELGQHPIGPGANKLIEDYINEAALLGGKELAQQLGISEEEGLQQFINTESFQQIREEIILQTIQMKYSGIDSQKFKTFTSESFIDFKRDEGFKKAKDDAKTEAIQNIQFAATRAGISVKEYTKRTQMRGLYQAISPTGIALKQETESGSIIERKPSGIGALTNEQIKSLGGIRRVGADIVFMEKKARLAPSLLRRALEGKREFEPFSHMSLVQDALNAMSVRDTQGVNITGFGGIGASFAGSGLILKNDDPRLKGTAGMGPIQAEVFIKTGQDIGKVAEVIGAKEAERIAKLEGRLSYYTNTGGGLSAGLAYNLANMGGADPLTRSMMNKSGSNFNEVSQLLLGSGAISATAAFQVPEGSIKVPRWVAEERAKFRAYMNSPEGVAEIINRRRNQFASDFYFERYAGGESPITQRQARAVSGYFAPGEADKALFKAIVGREVSGLPVGVQALMKIRRSFTEPIRGPGGHAFQTFMKRMGDRHRQQNAFLRTAVTRFEGGNYGEFEATSLYGLNSHTANVLSSELNSEQRVFQERFGTPLGMDYNTFAKVMSTAQRGLSEMEDRLRWNQRLDSISTGATVI